MRPGRLRPELLGRRAPLAAGRHRRQRCPRRDLGDDLPPRPARDVRRRGGRHCRPRGLLELHLDQRQRHVQRPSAPRPTGLSTLARRLSSPPRAGRSSCPSSRPRRRCASIGVLGADVLWAVPLGHELVHGHLPGSIAFADGGRAPAGTTSRRGPSSSSGRSTARSAATAGSWSARWSRPRSAFGALAEGLRREAPSGGRARRLGARARRLAAGGRRRRVASVLAGALPAAALARRASTRAGPGQLIWLAVPLLALWGNLHGGVLAGWALLAVLPRARARPAGDPRHRARRARRGDAGALPQPGALAHAVVLPGRLRERAGAPRRATSGRRSGPGGFDLLLVAAALALVVLAVAGRARIALWEVVALVGLAAATVHVARTGVFFLFLAAYPAARGLRLRGPKPRLLARRRGRPRRRRRARARAVSRRARLGARSPRGPPRRARPVLATSLLGGQVARAGRTRLGEQPDRRLPPERPAALPRLARRSRRAALPRCRTPATSSRPAGSPAAASRRTIHGSCSSPRTTARALYRVEGV